MSTLLLLVSRKYGIHPVKDTPTYKLTHQTNHVIINFITCFIDANYVLRVRKSDLRLRGGTPYQTCRLYDSHTLRESRHYILRMHQCEKHWCNVITQHETLTSHVTLQSTLGLRVPLRTNRK